MIEVIRFSAKWCGPCQLLRPKFKEISENLKFKDIKFIEIDIDEKQDITAKYNIRSIPTVIIKKDDNIVERIVGYAPEKIEQTLNNVIKD